MVDLEKLIGLLTTREKRKEDLSHEERDAIIDSRHDPDTPPSFEIQRIEWKRQVTNERSNPVESARNDSAGATSVTLLEVNAAFVNSGFRFSREQRKKSAKPRTRDELSVLIERTVEWLNMRGYDITTMSVVKHLGDSDERNILRAHSHTDTYRGQVDPKSFTRYFRLRCVHWEKDGAMKRTNLKQMGKRIKTASEHLNFHKKFR